MTSLRQSLIDQGVTDESALRKHISFVMETEQRFCRRLDLSRYRVDPQNPNKVPMLQG